MIGRIMSVDHGEVRTGLAVSDPLGLTAQPLSVIDSRDPDAAVKRICDVAKEREIVGFVIGLPLHMNATEGKRAKEARRFGDRLAQSSGLPVEYFDERLSTREAERAMLSTGATHRTRKKHRDTLAAQIILQAYLDSRRRSEPRT